MSAYSPELVSRLVKFCGLLGSEHAGERAAAGLKASKLLVEHGLTWGDVIAPGFRIEDRSTAGQQRPPGTRADPKPAELLRAHQREAWLLMASGYPWDEWKSDFLRNMRGRNDPPTSKQESKLRECRAMVNAWRKGEAA